jgi:hypothetical protein
MLLAVGNDLLAHLNGVLWPEGQAKDKPAANPARQYSQSAIFVQVSKGLLAADSVMLPWHAVMLSPPPVAHLQFVFFWINLSAFHTSGPGTLVMASWLAPPMRMIGDGAIILNIAPHACAMRGSP